MLLRKNRGDAAELTDGDDDKKVISFFQEKNSGDTVSCRPGDANPSDVTGFGEETDCDWAYLQTGRLSFGYDHVWKEGYSQSVRARPYRVDG